MNNLKLQSFSKLIVNTFLITLENTKTIEYTQWTELNGKIIDEDFEYLITDNEPIVIVSDELKEQIKQFTDLIPNS